MKYLKYLRLISILTVIGLMGLLVWNMLPRTNCCEVADKNYQAYDALVNQATIGDLAAIRALYKLSKDANRDDSARMWALNGAIAGDGTLANEYSSIYKTLNANLRQADEMVIRKNQSKEGAQRIASSIGLSLSP